MHLNSPFAQLLCTVGDGSGTTEANGDYSDTPELFKIQPPSNEIYIISRMIVMIRDTNISAEKYGGIVGGLTNGINVDERVESKIDEDLLGGFNVKSNADWARVSYDVDLKSWGPGDEMIVMRWSFDKSGVPLKLDGYKSGRLVVTCSDDLTGLASHTFLVQGFRQAGNGQASGALAPVPSEPPAS